MTAPLTDRVRKTMQMADSVRMEANCNQVSTEHVLIALIRAGGVAKDALERLGVTEDKVKATVAESLADFKSIFAKQVHTPEVPAQNP